MLMKKLSKLSFRGGMACFLVTLCFAMGCAGKGSADNLTDNNETTDTAEDATAADTAEDEAQDSESAEEADGADTTDEKNAEGADANGTANESAKDTESKEKAGGNSDDDTTDSSDDVKNMTPDELFTAFCEGRVQAEYLNEVAEGEEPYFDGATLDFSDDGDVSEIVSHEEPVDLDNDGEDEFILWNPVYGDMCFDCKDGKVVLFAQGEGTTGVCSYTTYQDATWIVHQDTSHMGRRYYRLDKFDGDLNIVDSFNLYWTADDEEEKDRTYYYNDKEITEEEFNKYYSEIFE